MQASVPCIPESAPFTVEQRAWLNGFLAGLFARQPGAAPAPAVATPSIPLTVLFGSQTGTTEALARRAAKEAGQRGFQVIVADMAKHTIAKLAGHNNVLVLVSTFGEGEPPDGAKPLHAALKKAAESSGGAPLASVRYSVCALGDTNYTQFCQCGRDFDRYLEKLGGARVTPRVECDMEYEQKFAAWLDVVAHECCENLVGGDGVFNGDL